MPVYCFWLVNGVRWPVPFCYSTAFMRMKYVLNYGSHLVAVFSLSLWICSGFSFPRRNHPVETRGRSTVWRKGTSISTVRFCNSCPCSIAATFIFRLHVWRRRNGTIFWIDITLYAKVRPWAALYIFTKQESGRSFKCLRKHPIIC